MLCRTLFGLLPASSLLQLSASERNERRLPYQHLLEAAFRLSGLARRSDLPSWQLVGGCAISLDLEGRGVAAPAINLNPSEKGYRMSTLTQQIDVPSRAGERVQRRINQLAPWFHNLRLSGIETAPDHFLGDYPAVKFASFHQVIPEDLTGKTVLDIGCNAGFYSIEMKRRGAARVVGIDVDEHYLRQARFAAEVNGVEAEFHQLAVWDVAQLKERFDLVIFMGVLYHLRHPLLALDLIHEHVAKDLLLFQSMQRGSRKIMKLEEDYDIKSTALFDEPGYPKMHFIEHRYSHDPTNWWVPNRACSEAMLRSAGFHIEARPEHEVYLCRWHPLQAPADGPHCVYPSKRVP